MRFALLTWVVLVSLTITACKESEPAAALPRPVQVWTLGSEPAPLEQTFAGQVRARYEADLAFRVGGKVIERRVELGQEVAAGEVLARLDAADLDLALSAARAELSGAEADALKARQELTRVQGLYTQKFVGQSALDAAVAAKDAAEARVNALRAQSRQSGNQAQYSALLASKDGIITALNLELGQVVAAGAPVLRMAYDGEREVHVRVGEVAGDALRRAQQDGQALQVTLWARPGMAWTGTVREIAPALDAARAQWVKVRVPELPSDVPLGATAQVALAQPAPPDTLWLPTTALFQQGDQPAVWVVEGKDTLRLQPVMVQAYTHDGVRVRGLSAGMRVVAAGVHALHEGQVVRPQAYDGAAARGGV